jgi:hypothetical protein
MTAISPESALKLKEQNDEMKARLSEMKDSDFVMCGKAYIRGTPEHAEIVEGFQNMVDAADAVLDEIGV